MTGSESRKPGSRAGGGCGDAPASGKQKEQTESWRKSAIDYLHLLSILFAVSWSLGDLTGGIQRYLNDYTVRETAFLLF